MTSSTIFINEPTVVDHSFIDRQGRIVGGSVNPTFLVTGEVSADENVVLDFSKAKARIKALIDDPDNGFDHKCWVVQGFSKIIYVRDTISGEHINDWDYLASAQDPNRPIAVHTASLYIQAPKSAFRFVTYTGYLVMNNQPQPRNVNAYIVPAMEQWLNANMPTFSVEVKMREHAIPVTPDRSVHLFRYVHGLKHSSSWGCQNIAHGHLSFIDVDAQHQEAASTVLGSIARDLDETIFISAENFVQDEYFINISYESQTRGPFTMGISKTAAQKFVVLETETTIEHIIEFVAARYKTQLKSIGATHLYVSEGLSKGAQLKLDYE